MNRRTPGAGVFVSTVLSVGVIALLSATREGDPLPYLVGAAGILGGYGAGWALTSLKHWAGLAFAAAFPLLLALVNGSMATGATSYTNATGSVALLACSSALVCAQRTGGAPRVVALVWALLMGLVPWVYDARTALLGVLTIAVVATFVRRQRATRLLGAALATALLLVIGVTVSLGLAYEEGGRTSSVERAADASLGQFRQHVWSDALTLIDRDPLLGVGPDRFSQEAPSPVPGGDTMRPHSAYLGTAAELGIVGAGFLLAAVGAVLCPIGGREYRSRSPILLAALGILCINAAIDYVFHFPAVLIAGGLVFGSDVSGPHAVHTKQEIRSQRQALLPSGWAAPAGLTLGIWVLLATPLPGLNPLYSEVNEVELSSEGAVFTGSGMLRADEPPIAGYQRLVGGTELTIEGWLASATRRLAGPARIMSSSAGIDHRNFTLAQKGSALVFRLRTTETDWNGVSDELVVDDVFVPNAVRHIAVAYQGGDFDLYVDGVHRAQRSGPAGTFGNWVLRYPLVLGNEASGDRAWQGRIVRLGAHTKALSPSVIAQLAAQPSLPDASTTAGSKAREHLALSYDLRDDEATRPQGGSLVRPRRVPADPPGFLQNLLRTGTGTGTVTVLVRAALVSALFLFLSRLVLRARPPRLAPAPTGLCADGLSLFVAGTALFSRHTAGGDVSVWVLAAAAAGGAAGALFRRGSKALTYSLTGVDGSGSSKA